MTVQPFWYGWDSLTGESDSLLLERIRIEVKAADQNCFDYITLQYACQVDPDRMHLDGGVGVFGSACVAETTLRFRPGNGGRSSPPRHEDTKGALDGDSLRPSGGLGVPSLRLSF